MTHAELIHHKKEIEERAKWLLHDIFQQPHCTDPELKVWFEVDVVVKIKE